MSAEAPSSFYLMSFWTRRAADPATDPRMKCRVTCRTPRATDSRRAIHAIADKDTDMRVTFPSFDASVPTDVRRGARDSVITGCGYLFSLPGSPVGRPSVVVMEGPGGLKESRVRYGRMLADRGYVALVVDSFGARRLARTIETWRALRVLKSSKFNNF